jgi:hypothetical protein
MHKLTSILIRPHRNLALGFTLAAPVLTEANWLILEVEDKVLVQARGLKTYSPTGLFKDNLKVIWRPNYFELVLQILQLFQLMHNS